MRQSWIELGAQPELEGDGAEGAFMVFEIERFQVEMEWGLLAKIAFAQTEADEYLCGWAASNHNYLLGTFGF